MQHVSLAVEVVVVGQGGGRGGVTAAKGRWSWAVRGGGGGGVKVTVEQQVVLKDRRGGAPQCCCASSSLWRQPTAVMRAAPLPLPSSDRRMVTSHLGASSFTVCWKIREKLRGRGRQETVVRRQLATELKERKTLRHVQG